MAMSKKDLFEKQEAELSMFCKALGHPARVKIVKLLLIKNNQTCNELVQNIPLSQSTVSQHLGELRQAKIISGKSVSTSVIYSVDKIALSKAQKMLSDFFNANILSAKQATLF